MHVYINLFGRAIPAYGLMIITGVLVANLVAMYFSKKENTDFNDIVIIECYAVLGGFLGAKLLYLITAFGYIDWGRLTDMEYLASLIQGGFVFYGGLIGGLITVFVAGRLQKIDALYYVRSYICLVPLVHGFGRIGCFMAGCCYGIPYHGAFSVVFPENSYALSGVELFPVQLVEAICLILLSILLMYLRFFVKFDYTLELYLFLYGIIRFVLENFRYDAVRGEILGLSTSQWISAGFIVLAILLFVTSRNKGKIKDC
ncbi:MAG: prolipoprotein diacylglyceryl transferase [Lachnospiraceae bacterium]|nr:prolipoprotein diacylglyceryl transferase [Lachnospiraceae bacterium]